MKKRENKSRKIRSFTDLKVWQEGHRLVLSLYRLTREFPKEETYALTDQLRRAVVSVTSNVAEGFGRQTYREKTQYYYQAQDSLTELKNQLLIAQDLGYLSREDFDSLAEQVNLTHRLLQSLISKTKSFLNRKS